MTAGMDDTGPPDGIGAGRAGYRLSGDVRLGPVRLQVTDRHRSEGFYTRILGLTRADGGDTIRMGVGNGAEALVELVERPTARAVAPGTRLGLFHFAILLPDRRSLADFAIHAERAGVRLGMADHAVSEALYLHDPDGLGIEVYADRPRDTWRSRAGQWVMTTEPLDLRDLLAQAGAAGFRGMPTGSRIGHVHLHVADLAQGARFYHGALGFDEVVRDYAGALFLSAGGYHHHVGTNVWARAAPPPGTDDARLLSWTLIVPDEAEVERLVANATALGYPSAGTGVHGGAVLADPWGTAVEVVAGSHPVR